MLYKRKSSSIDCSSKAIENKNVFNLDLKISMLCESRTLRVIAYSLWVFCFLFIHAYSLFLPFQKRKAQKKLEQSQLSPVLTQQNSEDDLEPCKTLQPFFFELS